MKNALLLLVLSILFLAASCKTDDDMPLPITEDAHDILRCKINGEDWEPKGGDLFTSKYDLYYYSDTKGLELIARNTTNNSTLRGGLHINSIIQGLNFKNKFKFYDSVLTNSDKPEQCEKYDLDTLKNNFMEIQEIDTISNF